MSQSEWEKQKQKNIIRNMNREKRKKNTRRDKVIQSYAVPEGKDVEEGIVTKIYNGEES